MYQDKSYENKSILDWLKFNPLPLSLTTDQPPHITDVLEDLGNASPLKRCYNVDSTIKIVYPDGGGRARKVVSRCNHRMTGKFPSKKNSCMVHWESHIEEIGFHMLEASPVVKRYQEQPVTIEYELNGEANWHIPDALVEFVSGSVCFVEFKDSDFIHDKALIERSQFLADYLPFHGYRYMVIIADQMTTIPHDNAMKLIRHATREVSVFSREMIRKALCSVSHRSISDVMDILPAEHRNIKAIYRLILDGDLVYDVFSPITPQSLIGLNGRN